MGPQERTISENALVLFALLPCILATFWAFVRLVNWSMGLKKTELKYVMQTIYTDPVAAAIYRGLLLFTLAQLIISAYERWV